MLRRFSNIEIPCKGLEYGKIVHTSIVSFGPLLIG
jgi:hypothetical protein